MKTICLLLSTSLLMVLSSCAQPELTGTPNPYQGIYIGTESLEGGSIVPEGDYPLKIKISARGRISITDVDGITARGEMQGDRFRVVRRSPRQIFEGKVSGNTISGVTTENAFTGDGTFNLSLQEE